MKLLIHFFQLGINRDTDHEYFNNINDIKKYKSILIIRNW